MASIDNRIVNMDFQNASFQKGVSESLNSLKNLNQSIENTSGSKLDNISAGIENIGSKFTWLSTVGVAALATISSKVVSLGVNMVSNLVNPLIEGGKRRALNIEQAKFQFEGLGMDVEATMASALAAVKGTAYGLDEAARAAAVFGTSGMKAGDDMTKALRAVAGTAAMSGASYAEIADIFTDVASKGKAQAEDFNRLAARGVGATALVAKAMGVTEAEVSKMASKGQIDFKTFSTAMYDAFGEHATKANETYTGSLSNMKAALSRIGASFASPMFERQRQIFNALTPAIDAVATALEPVIALYSKWQDYIAKTSVNAITNTLIPFIEGLPPIFTNLSTVVENLGKAVTSFLTPLKAAFSEVFGETDFVQLFLTILTKVTEKLAEFSEKLILADSTQQKIKMGVTSFLESLKKIGEVLKNAGTAVVEFFKGFSGFSDIESSFTPSVNILEKLQDGLSKIAEASKNLPELARNAGKAIGTGLTDKFQGFVDVLGKISDWIKENISFKDILMGIFGGGAIVFLKKVYDLVSNVSGLMEKLQGIFDKTKGATKKGDGVMDVLKEQLGSLGDTLNAFTQSIKISSLVLIAGAITALSISLKMLSKIDAPGLTRATIAMGVLFGMLSVSLNSFTKSIAGVSGTGLISTGIAILLVATGVKSMAKAVQTLADIEPAGLVRGLAALTVVMGSLTVFLNKSKLTGVSVSSAASLVVLAASLKIIASALKDLGDIPAKNLATGLTGMGVALGILVGVLKGMSKVSTGSMASATSLLIASLALLAIGEALEKVGRLDWENIGRGLTGIGGALAELVIALKVMGTVKPTASLASSASLLIAVQALDDIGEALAQVGKLKWSSIAKGLTGIGGVLVEMGAVLTIMGKVSPGGALVSSGALVLAAQALEPIADSLGYLAKYSWGQIVNSMGGLSLVFTELGTVITVMGKISPVGGLVSAASLLVAVQALEPIADSISELGKLDWGEIARGLVGMSGALAAVGATITVIGSIGGGLPAILGSGSLLIAVQALEPLADALSTIGDMSWGEIARGVTGMAGALTVLAGGALLNTLSAIGGASMGPAVDNLDTLAEGVASFAELDWDEIGRGLTSMAGALGVLAGGSILNTLGYLGGLSIENVAEPLGTLADSVAKWADVEVPDDLATSLANLAYGVSSWNFAWLGSEAIASAAAPLGTLAKSISEWTGITVPDSLGENLSKLASGVSSWNWAWLGGKAIASAAEPLGTLADAVRKWSNITVPENMQANLTSLANGVQAWSFAFMGGWSMGGSVDALGNLAGAVRKWNNVEVPEGMQSKLTSLANGVRAWSFAFMGGWSMGLSTDSLSDLAGAVRKWSGVTIPDNMESNLKSLANGVKAFSWAFNGGLSMGTAVEPLASLASSVRKWNNVTVPENLEANLKSLSSGIKSFGWFSQGSGSIADSIDPIANLAGAVRKWQGMSVASDLGSNLSSLAEGVKSFYGASSSAGAINDLSGPIGNMADAVRKWMGVEITPSTGVSISNLANGLSALGKLSGLEGVPGIISGIATSMVILAVGLASSSSSLGNASTSLNYFAGTMSGLSGRISGTSSVIVGSVTNMRTGITNQLTGINISALLIVANFGRTLGKLPAVVTTAMILVRAALSRAGSNFGSDGRSMVTKLYSGIRSALYGQVGSVSGPARVVGSAISSGIASGIYANSGAISVAARTVAYRALASAKSALGIHSPSKRFADEVGAQIAKGTVLGITSNLGSVKAAGEELAEATTVALSKAQSVLENSGSVEPTIKPVMDLSDVSSKSTQLASMLSSYDTTLSTSYSKAAAISAGLSAKTLSEQLTATNRVVNLTYNQTNTSPKALSNAEIYRKTRNQLSTIKKGLDISV